MDRRTVEVYERGADKYEVTRPPDRHAARAAEFATRVLPGRPAVDLGCGPGGHLTALGGAVGLDAAATMLELARRRLPGALLVRADLEHLPFRDRSLGGAWARNAYVHIEKADLPLALAQLHRAMPVDAPLTITVLVGEGESAWSEDDLPGRFFAYWSPERFDEVVAGAGFAVEGCEVVGDAVWVRARRERTLPDFVGPEMRLLVCGLNPSLVAADAGYGYAGATNRFWPAAVAAGLVSRPRDPFCTLEAHGVGMTDLVKRATPRAAELTGAEYTAGAGRLRRLVEWLRPGGVVFVGLAGWRVAVDRRARPGIQPDGFAGVPAYVMPSTSGLNAHTGLGDLVEHLRRALEMADAPSRHVRPTKRR